MSSNIVLRIVGSWFDKKIADIELKRLEKKDEAREEENIYHLEEIEIDISKFIKS